MMSVVDLPSAIRRVPLLAPFQQEPYLRLLPADFATEWFLNAYKRAYNTTYPIIRTGTYTSEFMRSYYGQGKISIEHIEGNEYLNIKDTEYDTVYTLDNCEDSTNGTWQAIGAATNIAYDENHKIVGTASLKFDVPITTATFWVFKDDFADVASATDRLYITMDAFFPVYIPSVTIRYWVDASNYHEVTSTADYLGKRFTTGWNTIPFDLSTKTTTGTVGNDDITYFAYRIATDITATPTDSFKIDGIYLTDEYSYDLEYYSNSVVIDKWGEHRMWNLITSETDFVVLNQRELILFLHQFSVISGIDNRPDSGITEFNVYSKQLAQDYEKFRMDFPSQKILLSSTY